MSSKKSKNKLNKLKQKPRLKKELDKIDEQVKKEVTDPYEHEFSFDDHCPPLNDKNVDEYLRYVKNHPQDGNNLFDRRRKLLMYKLITEVSRLRTISVSNKNRASKERLQELKSRLTEPGGA